CLRRVGRRGLASASIEGMLASSAPYVAVIDADLQHDETQLGAMLERARAGADLVIGTRFDEGGDVGNFSPARQRISGFSAWLSRLTFKGNISDPMSGFFLLRRETLDRLAPKLTGTGFKILVDILASTSRPLKIEEVPYTFGERQHGQSKLDTLVALEFVELLLDKLLGRYLPVRFLKFALVGGSGLVLHLAVLWAVLGYTDGRFAISQAVATGAAIASNFFINNWFTYRDRRLRGWAMVAGLASFYGICGLGAVASVGVGSLIYVREPIWWIAGAAGALVGAVWNFAVSSVYTWRKS
ncbi:MAG: GtrA family protein, partial [Alphaproteobacteria bacterium]